MGIGIQWRDVEGVAVLDLSGQSSIMDGTILQQTVRSLTRDGKKLFIFNMKDLKHLDSFGLGQLVSTYISVRDHERGDIKIVNTSPGVRDLLRYTRIDSVMQVLPSEEAAIEELKKHETK